MELSWLTKKGFLSIQAFQLEQITHKLKSHLQSIKKGFLLTLTCCDLCGSRCESNRLLCTSCLNQLPRFKTDLIQGDLLNWPAINKALPKVQFDHLVCLAPYQKPFDTWIGQLKYRGRFELGRFFADLLVTHWHSLHEQYSLSTPDLILSVPLHINKWQSRGYNQAHLIAQQFADQINIPYLPELLVRMKPTQSQVGKSGKVRRKQLTKAFEISHIQSHIQPYIQPHIGKHKGLSLNLPKHVLLIDDVVTTGATTSEISRCLKKAGVEKVTVLAVCLTLPE